MRPEWRRVPAAVGSGLFLAAWLSACGGDAASRPESAESGGPRQPVENVLLITIDTLRADTLGFAGHTEVKTPILDRLAAGGVFFPNAHAHNVVTLPSHANILTGLYPYQHGVRDNSGFSLPAGLPTAATLLQAAGFATGAFVAAYPLDARYGLARGFDVYDDDYPRGSRPTEFALPERPGREVVGRALAWWSEKRTRRRFLWVHVFEPHAPYQGAEPFASRHRGNPYLGEVETVDSLLAPLLEPFLDGAEPATLIVLTSDHGEALGDHGEATHGIFAYEATLRVPLVLWGGGFEGGARARAARHVDLLPTMLAAAGVTAPPELPGRALSQPSLPDERPLPSYFEALMGTLSHGWAPLRGVLEGQTKLISLPLPELYDLATDPGETENLFERQGDRARALARRLPSESVWPPVAAPATAAEEAALRSLGYLAGGARARTEYGVDDDPKTLIGLDNKLQLALGLYQRRELEQALKITREVLAERQDMGSAYSLLSQILLERGATGEAIRSMERAASLGVASDSVVRQLALSLSEVGRFDDALSLLEPRRRDGDRDDLNALGVVLSQSGRHAEARQVLRDVLAGDPLDPVARENLALVALRLGEWAEARDEARRALAENPSLALSWNYLGTALYNLGERQEALAALERSLAYEPSNFDALYNVAAVAVELGDRPAARLALERFIAEAPQAVYEADIRQAREWLRRLDG